MNEMNNTNTISTADDAAFELAVTSDRFGHGFSLADDIQTAGGNFCSLVAADNKARVTLYNACSNPEKLSAHVNEPIKMAHVFAEVIQCANEQSGEIVNCPRVVIIDDHGKGYQAVSVGIYNSVKRIIGLFGNPASWDSPHTIKCKNVDIGGGQHTYTLEVLE